MREVGKQRDKREGEQRKRGCIQGFIQRRGYRGRRGRKRRDREREYLYVIDSDLR